MSESGEIPKHVLTEAELAWIAGIADMIRIVRDAERERAAKIADSHATHPDSLASEIAAAIRNPDA